MESFIELATEVKQHTIRLMSGWLSETAVRVGIDEQTRLKIIPMKYSIYLQQYLSY